MNNTMLDLQRSGVAEQIKRWLVEDVGSGDITSLATIPAEHHSKGIIHMKEAGVLAGGPVARMVFHTVDPTLRFHQRMEDGKAVSSGDVIIEVEGLTRHILQAERLALNLLQRLSGIATQTSAYVQRTTGRSVRLVDTRKTTPGHRLLEKYAVRMGGGWNHRMGLYDAVMIKDNHIKASGGVKLAVQAARSLVPHTTKIEVEVENEQQLHEAVRASADIIMLDNMEIGAMTEAVAYIRKQVPHILIEASGGVNLNTVSQIADTGVDIISVGSLTSSVKALDISLDLNSQKGSGQL